MKRFELSTLSLARRCSTTELHPQVSPGLPRRLNDDAPPRCPWSINLLLTRQLKQSLPSSAVAALPDPASSQPLRSPASWPPPSSWPRAGRSIPAVPPAPAPHRDRSPEPWRPCPPPPPDRHRDRLASAFGSAPRS